MVFCCLNQEENEDRDEGKGFRKENKARGEGDYLGEGEEMKLAKEEESHHLSYVHERTE